jgi:hypothetical protein
MRKIRQLLAEAPNRALWILCLLVVIGGIVAATIGFGVGSNSAPPSTTPATSTTSPPRTASSRDGTCNGRSNPTPPSTSTYAGYTLKKAMTGPQIIADAKKDGYNNYAEKGPIVLPPGGWIAANHIVVTNKAIEELGYDDAGQDGVTGAGMNIANDVVKSYGGFTYCFSLSGRDWQNVAIVFEAWPADSVWQEGEIDFLAGSPAQTNWDVVQDGGCNATTHPCNVVASGQYPSSAVSGMHEVTVLWNPTTGDSFYLDGKLFKTVPPSATVGIPSTPHVPVMQLQDLGENSSVPQSSPLAASRYWVATYTYSP